jgi:cysteinyl-tRNA synthetase
MAERTLGVPLDIHGGGSDLVFPHHENEIAQTEAGRGVALATTWMHNGMVELDEAKMAKSVGNIRLLRGALDEYGRDAIVMYFVMGHYRGPLAFSEEALADARRSVGRIADFVRRLDRSAGDPEGMDAYVERFFDALADDFNTPAARAALFDWIGEGNRRIDAGEALGPGRLGEMLHAIGMERLLEEEAAGPPEEALELARRRDAARAERDYAAADRIRDELAALGWIARDTPEGTRLVPGG